MKNLKKKFMKQNQHKNTSKLLNMKTNSKPVNMKNSKQVNTNKAYNPKEKSRTSC